jgi:reactive chlorine resistance protein C
VSTTAVPLTRELDLPALLQRAGGAVLRYGLVAFILFFGAFKFTAVEAEAIRPLLENSPLLSWLYAVTSVRGASRAIGAAEIAIALLIASRAFSPRLSALGSIGAIGMFVTTLSFLVTTPGIWVTAEGFPVPAATGAFIVKDIFLLGAAVWSAGEALRAQSFSYAQPRS